MAKIKFSFAIKQWPLDIGLDDISPKGAIIVHFSFLKDWLNVLKSKAHFDSIASVTILTWLHNPSIVLLLIGFNLIIAINFFRSLVIVSEKLKIFLILHAILDVKG